MIKNRIKSGFNELDKRLMFFEPGKLCIIAGRPGMGKTSLMLDMTLNIAKQVPVHIFSLELLTEHLLKRLSKKTKSIDNLPIYIYDKPFVTVKEIAQMNINDGIIFIDYLQLISPEKQNASISLVDETLKIVKDLKNLSMQMDVPVVVFSQLSRGVDKLWFKKGLPPTCEDIPHGGTKIASESDTIIFLYRKAYYNHDECGNEVELTVIKKMIGCLGTAVIHFDEKTGTFYE